MFARLDAMAGKDPWYKVVTPRKEVREGRSFSPDEFAIALEQVTSGTAPLDYRDPVQFFSRTCFTRAPFGSHPTATRLLKLVGSQHPHPVLVGSPTDIFQRQSHIRRHPRLAVQQPR